MPIPYLQEALGGLCVLLLIACTTLYGLWQHAKVTAVVEKANAERLSTALQQEQSTNQALTSLAGSNASTIKDLGDKLNESHAQTQQQSAELNALRTTEAGRALEAPFDRGNAADGRKRRILMRFEGRDSPYSPSVTGTDGGDGATGPEPRGAPPANNSDHPR